MTGFVAGALAKSSGANPAVQGWYAWFLQHLVLPNAGFFSFLITYGEFAVGLGVLLGVLTGIAAGFGVLMNLNYLLAGTVSINPVLGMFGLFLCFSWRICGWIGVDRWVLPRNDGSYSAVISSHVVWVLGTNCLLRQTARRGVAQVDAG